MIEPMKKKALDRLKRAKGQIDGIIRMIEADNYCADIMSQVLAAQGALKGVTPLILESHLNTCGAEHLGSKNKVKREKFIREIVRTCELSSR
jgi:CsoR family transcriptional regulator, copper-sensing transcriptional repressor